MDGNGCNAIVSPRAAPDGNPTQQFDAMTTELQRVSLHSLLHQLLQEHDSGLDLGNPRTEESWGHRDDTIQPNWSVVWYKGNIFFAKINHICHEIDLTIDGLAILNNPEGWITVVESKITDHLDDPDRTKQYIRNEYMPAVCAYLQKHINVQKQHARDTLRMRSQGNAAAMHACAILFD